MCDVNAKTKQLKKLENFINSAETELASLFDEIGWSKDRVLEKEKYVTCPLDPGHTMPEESLKQHVELCSWIKKGYTKEEKANEIPSSHFCYTNSAAVVPVFIDKETQQSIIMEAISKGTARESEPWQMTKEVPFTMEHAFTELTPSERFAVYDYVVRKSKAANKRSNIKLEDLQFNFEQRIKKEEQKAKSDLELIAQERNYKRRRQSYRSKNVHITRKTYTQIMKEVIENQTEHLKEMIKEENEEENITSSETPWRFSKDDDLLPSSESSTSKTMSPKHQHSSEKKHYRKDKHREKRGREPQEKSSHKKKHKSRRHYEESP